MKYEEMSDFQINKKVAIAKKLIKIRPKRGSETAVQIGGYRSYDYCNNPSDAWPIIVENRIEVHPREIRVGRNEYIKGWGAKDESDDWVNFCKHENPLRAAMIVFLKMQDGES